MTREERTMLVAAIAGQIVAAHLTGTCPPGLYTAPVYTTMVPSAVQLACAIVVESERIHDPRPRPEVVSALQGKTE